MRKILQNDILFLEYPKNRDDRIFALFYEKNEQWLNTILSKVIRKEEDRKDTSQKIWNKVQSKSSEYNPEIASVRTWIYSIIARGIILHYLRDNGIKNKKFVNVEDIVIEDEQVNFIENLPADEINTFQDFDHYHLNFKLRTAIQKLNNDSYQNLVLLHYFGKLSLKHIAILSKENYNTIRTRHDRAKNKLNSIINSLDNDNE